MKPEKLDRRISFERASRAQNDYGEEIETWLPMATVWAAWRRASARETQAAAEVSASVTDVFEVRWSSQVSDLTPKDRVIFDERIYDIAAVQEIGRREGLRIGASARAE